MTGWLRPLGFKAEATTLENAELVSGQLQPLIRQRASFYLANVFGTEALGRFLGVNRPRPL